VSRQWLPNSSGYISDDFGAPFSFNGDIASVSGGSSFNMQLTINVDGSFNFGSASAQSGGFLKLEKL
jgi:hypothetical protein